jgi:hypothetical protein
MLSHGEHEQSRSDYPVVGGPPHYPQPTADQLLLRRLSAVPGWGWRLMRSRLRGRDGRAWRGCDAATEACLMRTRVGLRHGYPGVMRSPVSCRFHAAQRDQHHPVAGAGTQGAALSPRPGSGENGHRDHRLRRTSAPARPGTAAVSVRKEGVPGVGDRFLLGQERLLPDDDPGAGEALTGGLGLQPR